MADFFQPVFWTLFISAGTLGGIFWMVYLLVTGRKVKLQPGETAKSTGHEWDGIEELNNPLPNWWVWMFYFTIFFGLGYLVLYPGLGVAKGIIEKSGAWYSYNGERIGQGRDNVRQFLRDNPDIASEIEARIREQLLPGKAAAKAEAEEEAGVEA